MTLEEEVEGLLARVARLEALLIKPPSSMETVRMMIVDAKPGDRLMLDAPPGISLRSLQSKVCAVANTLFGRDTYATRLRDDKVAFIRFE